ncbi:MAG: PSD1 and planctomycete cytochrome C domain-containing protein [Gemmataceae bacterium]|nr:PSD1 and planctomycete cytochrome C domain-containing protein [Gemmataceae bacterium]
MRTSLLLLALLPTLAVLSADAPGADNAASSDADIDFFEKKVRPVLVEHCYSCHSAAANKAKGDLLLDSRDGVRKGGESGSAIVPGKPDESLLIKAVRHQDELRMPPKNKLPAAVIADLEAWVKMGAPDPRAKATTIMTAASWEEVLRTRRTWWSLQPVRKPGIPVVKDGAWSAHPIDRFLRAGWEQAGLQPAGHADKRTLMRRLNLVLTGLPPTPEEVETFVKDDSPAAYEQLVDRLLASPHFGERWARHWLDVVRFSETHGNEWNYEVHHAWRYRDYLIRAINDDVPYDQFVREHIAGDLLPNPRQNRKEQINESVIGTAFYRFGEVNHDDCIEFRQIGFDLVDNQLDTLTKAFQATTVACARCHDHKLDAVSTKDYYALLGILRSSRLVTHTIDAPEVNAVPKRRLQDTKPALRKELAELWQRDVKDVGRYLLAAEAARTQRADAAELAKGLDAARLGHWIAALKHDKPSMEDPAAPWLALAGDAAKQKALPAAWKQIAERYTNEDRQRTEANEKRFVSFADFRRDLGPWRTTGQGLDDGLSRSGDFTVAPDGDSVVKAVLPAGAFTHSLSDKLNGTLRSPVLPAGKKSISFQVMGQRSSAVRLVSNNCQLNYHNYRALTTDRLQWVTFEMPEARGELRTYAELMTMFDNPKFPDQLSALGGDKENYKLPWEKATANPRSFFGVTRVVLHDGEAPKPELGHLRSLWAGPEPVSPADIAARYTAAVDAAIQAWARDQASDDDVRWLDWLLRRNLLANSMKQTPRLAELVEQYRVAERDLALPRVVPGIGDFDSGFEQSTFVRGDCLKPGEQVKRRYLEVLAGPRDTFTPRGSGRLDLAERLVALDNPLTARVMANRVWHHLYGSGLVRTVDDFGHMGEKPSHPELLDYLSTRLVEDGWSVKKLIRSIVLSRAFRMASRPVPAAQEVDPLNRLLHHYPARRVEAEAIRDSILAASGRLDRTLFGPSIQPFREKENADRRLFPGPLDGNGRRSIYIKVNLMEGPKFLSAFDLPGGKVPQGRRDVTNVPAQALALLNDPFVLQQAGVWAARLVARPDATAGERLDHMFQVTFSRPPSPAERERFEKAVAQFAGLHDVPVEGVLKSQAVWKDVAHALFNVKEFIYIP